MKYLANEPWGSSGSLFRLMLLGMRELIRLSCYGFPKVCEHILKGFQLYNNCAMTIVTLFKICEMRA